MRSRLSLLLLLLMGVVVVSLGVPLAGSVAAAEARRVYSDRAGDVALFASLVPEAGDPAAELALKRDLVRYDVLYGVAIGVVDIAGRAQVTGRSPLPLDQPNAAEAVSVALAGRLPDPPSRLWPWSDEPLTAAQPVVRDGNVVGAVLSVSDPVAARQRVLRTWALLAASVVLALVGSAVLAVRSARWLLRPVERLDAAAHRIAAGDLGARVPVHSGPPELRRLGGSFNDMAVHVEAAIDAQRAFVANAGHQLRNPLAALLVRLEGVRVTASDHAPDQALDEALDGALDRTLEDGHYLADTLDRMLALASAEHRPVDAAALDVATVVDERLRFWQVVAARRDIDLDRRGVPSAPGWHDASAVAGAVDAVVDNALKYSPEHSTVRVTVGPCAGDGPGGWVEVEVADEGPGLPPEEMDHVADRFWRSRSTSDQPGTGLGMSIASALLERNGGSLLVRPGDGGGLSVALLVPAGPPEPG